MSDTDKVKFADRVLQILDEHQEWNADTTDLIGEFAIELGLATTDEQGYFRQNVGKCDKTQGES